MKKKMNAALSLALVALLSLSLSNTVFADQPPDNVQGNWTIYSTSVKDGSVEIKHVQIAQYGNHITGYFEGPIQSGPIEGEVHGHRIRFDTVTRNVLHFSGDVFGDTMSGTYGIHGKHAPWQATRPATTPTPTPVPPSSGAAYQTQPVLAPPVAQTAYEAPAQATYQSPTPAYSPAPQTSAYPTTSYAMQTTSAPATGQSPAPAPLSSDQLNSLVAPIALYPDALVAQVLAAAMNPEQLTYADDWLAQNRNLTGSALAQAVDQQSWDPSIKALTQFPSVMDNLAHNLSWTSSLGQAFANQQADVMAAVQAMRAKAQAAGTLQSSSQITVTQPASNTIVIQPANPQVVYVPQYNPAVVFGAPVVVPYYVAPQLPVASFGLYFGTGITIGASFGGGGWVGGGFGWGWHAWNVNWGGGWGGGGGSTIIFNHNTYINNHTWNNNNYNGYHPWGGGAAGSQNHAWYGANGTFHPDGNYKPGEDTHYGPNGGYHPNGYYGPDGGWHQDKNAGQQLPNGGNNGNHGLIGGNGGVEHANGAPNGGAVGSQNHAWYGNNGTFHPDGNYKPGEDTHYGPNGGYHANGYYGPDGGFHPDKGTGPSNTPNGGNNGNHGLIGGNGGVQDQQSRNADRRDNGNLNSSRMSGDGRANRMESNRGRGSMEGRRSQPRMARAHAPAEHRSGGGGRRR